MKKEYDFTIHNMGNEWLITGFTFKAIDTMEELYQSASIGADWLKMVSIANALTDAGLTVNPASY